jgi:SAM-dependent methyltransferase
MMSQYHDAHLTPDPARAIVWRAIAGHLSAWIPPQAAVLELGAGYCDWINHVRAARRVAVDVWPDVARHAGPGVEPVVADLTTGLPMLADESFDIVLASNVFEHFQPDTVPTIVDDVRRLLRPNGRLLVIQPNFHHSWRRYFDDYTHRSVFTHVSLPALLRARGLTVDRVEPRFMPYSMQGSRIPITGWLVHAYLRSPIRPMAGQMLVVASKR